MTILLVPSNGPKKEFSIIPFTPKAPPGARAFGDEKEAAAWLEREYNRDIPRVLTRVRSQTIYNGGATVRVFTIDEHAIRRENAAYHEVLSHLDKLTFPNRASALYERDFCKLSVETHVVSKDDATGRWMIRRRRRPYKPGVRKPRPDKIAALRAAGEPSGHDLGSLGRHLTDRIRIVFQPFYPLSRENTWREMHGGGGGYSGYVKTTTARGNALRRIIIILNLAQQHGIVLGVQKDYLKPLLPYLAGMLQHKDPIIRECGRLIQWVSRAKSQKGRVTDVSSTYNKLAHPAQNDRGGAGSTESVGSQPVGQ